MKPDPIDQAWSAVAIIGMAGRFPRSANVDAFWINLRDGVDCISHFTEGELLDAGVDAALVANPNYVRARGVLDGIEEFDAGLFGFTPREAEITDPQQRVFLECAWEALEDAGHGSESTGGRSAVYAGAALSSYLLRNLISNPEIVDAVGAFPVFLANDKDHVATRVSYRLNLTGPSLAINCACSSSLAAVHVACQALLNMQCDLALAGGVSIETAQRTGYLYQDGGILSPDGHCRAFDARAAGTVGGSGAGVVVLRRLEDALAGGDRIRAVVVGSASNNDGSLKLGYTAPNVNAQTEVIAEALAVAGVDASTIGFVEAHGTATPLGDPIEVAALAQAFRLRGSRPGRCALGSVKTNVGHLDTAAGVTGLIKAVLALEHGVVPPSLHFAAPNPEISFDAGPFFVNTVPLEWPRGGSPRRAGVSSFGMGGTNVHVVLEEAPPRPESGPSARPQLLVLSAASPGALEAASRNLAEHLEAHSDTPLADVAFTLATGRRPLDHRRVLVATGVAEAATMLRELPSGRVHTARNDARHRPVAFLFPGQGAQHPGMAAALYRAEPVFRSSLDVQCERLAALFQLDLRSLLLSSAGASAPPVEGVEGQTRLEETAVTQPALFVVEYALAELWKSWGIEPDAMLGHSLGEFVAACVAGVFSLDDALAIVVERGRLMQEQPRGLMLAVEATPEAIGPLLTPALSLAAVNSPTSCVVSGPTEAIHRLKRLLDGQGILSRELRTSHAFHSAMMDPVVPRFRELVARFPRARPRLRFISNLTGTWITPEQALSPDYWARHLRETVRFDDGIGILVSESDRILVEVGPGRVLTALAMRHPRRVDSVSIHGSLAGSGKQDGAQVLDALGALWLAGVPVNWSGFYAPESRRRVKLPTYPFERRRFWVEPAARRAPGVHAPVRERRRLDPADWLQRARWKESGLGTRAAARHALQEVGWLILCDTAGVGRSLATRLRATGADAVIVHAGLRFEQHGDRDFTVQPTARGDYDMLFEHLRSSDSGTSRRRIVHLWNLDRDPRVGPVPPLDREFFSLLALAQAQVAPSFDGGEASAAPALAVVSSGLHSVLGTETLFPERAALLGPVRVIPQEYPHLTVRSIDLPPPGGGDREHADLVSVLLTELSLTDAEPVVAWRGKRRWVEMFEPLGTSPGEPEAMLRERGVYVITGGFGGIGFTLARHLARAVQARLVLIGRSPAAAAVAELEALGAEVFAPRADVTDARTMREVLGEARRRFGPIHGAIHAAGRPGAGAIQRKTFAVAEAVLLPHVRGARNLADELAGTPVDFIVFCSSVASLLGGAGQVDYCAASAFLDALARSLEASGTPATAIDWDTWRGVGMAANLPDRPELREVRADDLALGITPDEGVEIFQRVLAARESRIVVSTRDLGARIARSRLPVAWTLLKAAAEVPAQGQHARPAIGAPFVEPRDEVERRIAAIWQRALGVEPIGAYDGFFELGGDSLVGVQVAAALSREFEREIPAVSLFQGPTVADLAALLRSATKADAGLDGSRLRGERRRARRGGDQ